MENRLDIRLLFSTSRFQPYRRLSTQLASNRLGPEFSLHNILEGLILLCGTLKSKGSIGNLLLLKICPCKISNIQRQ